ncbi:MAG: hypothetical protein Q8L88_13745 [Bacteroidota bacterium]|nr:hypothetical protein [Bacteroidota bacterium]
MEKIFILIAASILLLSLTNAQGKSAAAAAGAGTEGVVKGGVGMTWIDGEAYYLVSLAPEIAFGKFGVGLDLNLHISSEDQKIRKEDFDETYDYIRIIRYLRYGSKGDEFYIRLGALDYSKLGHGSILYNYKNSPSVDARKIGTELDIDFGKWGVETVYGDFAAASLLGVRGYARPLQFTKANAIPIISNLEVGVTFASDMREDSKDTNYAASPSFVGPPKISPTNDGAMSVIGFDLGLPLLRLPVVDMTLYYDFVKILSFGSGMSVGLETNFSGMGLIKIFTKFERRFAQSDQYLPSYFNSFYELDRYSLTVDTAGLVKNFSSKAQVLSNTKSPGPGYFGSLLVDVLGTIQIEGSYQKLDLNPTSGIMHLGTNTGNKIPLIMVSAGYDKRNIIDNKDVFTLDERSLLYAEVGYKPYPFMIVSTLYTWTFAPEKNADGDVTGYKPQKRITPKVSFVFPL